MTFKNTIRLGTLWVLATLLGSACSSKAVDGTDSNTHFEACQTSADCPTTAPYECRRGLCVAATTDAGSGGSSGGICPPEMAGNQPCDGSIAQCWTPCAQGYRGQYVCSDGVYLAGRGLFPCGVDGGAASDSGGAGVAKDCVQNGDCEVRDRTCCETCGEATIADKLAMNTRSAAAWDTQCAGATCLPCVAPPDAIRAVCSAQSCELVDLKPYVACKADVDCQIVPIDCCACGVLASADLLSLSDRAGYLGARCPMVLLPPPATADCPQCPSLTLPSGITPHCTPQGICTFDFSP